MPAPRKNPLSAEKSSLPQHPSCPLQGDLAVMARKRLSPEERKAYEAGGFRFGGRPLSARAARIAELNSALAILRAWRARSRDVKASLAIPSARSLSDWRKGKVEIGRETRERIAIVKALGRRLTGAHDFVYLEPLPDLKRAGRPPLSGHAVLEGGRLSDLLGLLRQLVLAEEAATRRRARGQAKADRAAGER